MIKHFLEKIKTLAAEHKKPLVLSAFVFMMALISFGLGRLSVNFQQKDIVIEPGVPIIDNVGALMIQGGNKNNLTSQALSSGNFVASKNSHYYYLPDCATAKRIKDENKTWFNTEADAQAAGFVRGSGCFN